MTDERYDEITETSEPVATGLAHRGKRRRRIALIAGAIATAAVVSASTVIAAVSAGADIPTGWEARSFQGMTFAVPPGARTADEIKRGEEPIFKWNGPNLGRDDADAYVTILVRDFHGDLPEQDGAEAVTVRGALAVRSGIGPAALATTDRDDPLEVTTGGVQIFTADAFVLVGVQFPAGPVGEQMAADLIASIDVTGLDPSA